MNNTPNGSVAAVSQAGSIRSSSSTIGSGGSRSRNLSVTGAGNSPEAPQTGPSSATNAVPEPSNHPTRRPRIYCSSLRMAFGMNISRWEIEQQHFTPEKVEKFSAVQFKQFSKRMQATHQSTNEGSEKRKAIEGVAKKICNAPWFNIKDAKLQLALYIATGTDINPSVVPSKVIVHDMLNSPEEPEQVIIEVNPSVSGPIEPAPAAPGTTPPVPAAPGTTPPVPAAPGTTPPAPAAPGSTPLVPTEPVPAVSGSIEPAPTTPAVIPAVIPVPSAPPPTESGSAVVVPPSPTTTGQAGTGAATSAASISNDISRLSPAGQRLSKFFAGEGLTDFGHNYIDMFDYSDEDMEGRHNYIQWLFPTAEKSAHNTTAPLVDDGVRKLFENHPILKQQHLVFLDLMLWHYGLSRDETSGEITKKDDFKTDQPWLKPQDHNHFRLTRMMKSLWLLGSKEPAYQLQAALNKIGKEHNINPQTRLAWATAFSKLPKLA